MRRFVLARDVDVSGVSGTGVVAWGVQWPDGRVAYRWNSGTPTSCSADSIAHVMTIHGHDGATRLAWLDTDAEAQAWLEEEGRHGGAAG